MLDFLETVFSYCTLHLLSIAISIDNPGPNDAATTCSRPPSIERNRSSTIKTVGLEEFPRVR